MTEELDRVMDALSQADEAGNTEDAQELADYARALIQNPQEKEDSNLGAMPFANKAIAGALGAPADLIRSGVNLIPGVDLPEPVGGSKSIQKGMELVGAKLPEEGREPETVSEHMGRGLGEVAAMLSPVGAIFKVTSGIKAASAIKGFKVAGTAALPEAVPNLTSTIANSIWQSMVKHPYLTMLSEATGGMGAGVGRGLAEDVESPTGKAFSEVGGGVVGGVLPFAALHTPSALALRYGKRILRQIQLPFTGKGSAWRSGDYTKGLVADPSKTLKGIAEKSIGDLPPVVQAADEKLLVLYKSLSKVDPVSNAKMVESISKSIVKLEGEMRKLGFGSPELLAEMTQKRVAAIELKIDKRIAESVAVAQRKLNALPVAQRKVAESRIVRTEIETAMRKERSDLNKLWAEVPKDYEVGFDKTRQVYGSIIDDLADAQKVDIPFPLKKSMIITNDKLQGTTLKEMQGLRSKLLEVSRKARKDGQWNKSRIAEDVADAILEDLGISAGKASTPEAASLQAALAATRQFKTRFESGVVGKILGYSKSGAPAIDPNLTLDISIGRMKTKGSIDIDKVALTPEAKAATERYLARSFVDFAAPKGEVDLGNAVRWIKNNESILDRFPNLRSQLTDTAKAQEFANKTRITMEARKKAIQDPKISVSAKFLKVEDLDKTVGAILKSNNPESMTRELVLQSTKDPTGNAFMGLKGAFVDHILERSYIGGFNDVGERTLSGHTLLNLINNNKVNASMGHLFTPEQMIRMRSIGKELAKIENFQKSVGNKPDIVMKDIASTGLTFLSRMLGARLGGRMGKESAGGSLQMAQMYSGAAKNIATKLTRDKAVQMVHDAILSKDPTFLQALLLPMDKPGSGKVNMLILNKRINLWLAGTGKRIIEEDIPKETDQKNIKKAPNKTATKKYIVVGDKRYENLGDQLDGGKKIRDPKTGETGVYYKE